MIRGNRFLIAVWTLIAVLALTGPAPAYIGPGGGMEFVTYAMWLVAMMGAAFLSFILWPVYKVLGWFRGAKTQGSAEQAAANGPVADVCSTSENPAPAENKTASPTASVP
jgi:hypothetical protein